ncbi:MAG TPA: pilus assembly PilX N-terminal domain-containing protein [Candidatus Saccharimonadales bacterium]
MSSIRIRPSLRQSQNGMISIMTAMILLIVISLIVLGFAQQARRNQRVTLDRQLSTQAFYAAESGVNDVRELIANAASAGTTIPDKTSCSDTGAGGFYASLNPTLDAQHRVSYSCIMVDASPTVLRYSDVGTTSTIIPMTSASATNFRSITITLQPKVTGNPLVGCPNSTLNQFQPTGSWSCGYGVLRFDLVPAAGGGLTADGLRNATMTTFAIPFSAGGTGTIPYVAGIANANNLIGMSCTASNCSLTINGLSQSSYYMRISSLYRDMAMQVTGQDNTGAVHIAGAQVVIDATGKSQDVLRRIQVNVPVLSTSQNQLSDYALQSTTAICKRYAVMDGYFAKDSAVSGITGGSRLCGP